MTVSQDTATKIFQRIPEKREKSSTQNVTFTMSGTSEKVPRTERTGKIRSAVSEKSFNRNRPGNAAGDRISRKGH